MFYFIITQSKLKFNHYINIRCEWFNFYKSIIVFDLSKKNIVLPTHYTKFTFLFD